MKTNTLILLFYILLIGCKSDKKETNNSTTTEKIDNTIEVVTNVMDFVCVDTIKSGWNTFKFINKSNEPHFIMIDDYPDDKTIDTINAKVSPPFDKGMALIMEGKIDEAMAAFGALPDWFPQVVFIGGTGLVSPKHTGLTTIKLDPGFYVMECYVKMADGRFHSSMGMVKELWVKDEDSGNNPPEADVKMSISSTEGITYEGTIHKGWQTFEVYFKDQIVHENFVGHDVNLVKLGNKSNLEELEAWMNWMDPKGLITPMPNDIIFLGGANNTPAGNTEFFKANLDSGNYAFIAEVPNSKSKGMLKMFTVE